ncbi:hypothetical protein F5Y17DRAFT_414757 [Xylariaceae sp. FL0594]|nr:hypothetical protein F5Y17DRAFT_414757 [Xylariaceae sp. FL0594]
MMAAEGDTSTGPKYDQAGMDTGSNDEESGPLIDGISNQDIWRLTRRFNKQVFHLKATHEPLPGGLDFNVAEGEDFSPNKFRAQLERLYMTVIIGSLAGFEQLVRLRSWREPRRTAYFCIAYFIAWTAGLLVPCAIATLMALISSQKVRRALFPPAPVALVDYKTGGVSKPTAGVLGSSDSATGAPENYKGEAVENEASNFVTGLAAIAVNVLTDEDPQHGNDQKSSHISDVFPAPNEAAVAVAVAKDKAGGVTIPSLDKTKKPMEEVMWSYTRPAMHSMCRISDTWERFANLLYTTGPIDSDGQRKRLIAYMTPLLIASLFLSSHLVYKALTFVTGSWFFGEPLMRRANAFFDLSAYRLNNTILKGVPTDVQMTVTMLRYGEARDTPLAPPPTNREAPVDEPYELTPDVLDACGPDRPLGATDGELVEAVAPDHEKINRAGGRDDGAPETDDANQAKWRSRAVQVARTGAKVAVKTAMTLDKLRAKAGQESAKTRLGAVPPSKGKASKKQEKDASPSVFQARYHGQPGYVYLNKHSDDNAEASVSFTTEVPLEAPGYDGPQPKPLWTVPINDITALNKYHGYGAKSKLITGWALEKEIRDGLEITDLAGNSRVLTAMARRDELFNRLCAIGGQAWEIW